MKPLTISPQGVSWFLDLNGNAGGVANDANHYAIETMGNPAYPIELLRRVITVSIETMKIVNGLPELELE